MTDDLLPLLRPKDYAAPSVFEPANLLREARRQIALQEPDIVFLDLGLADENGIYLLDAARTLLNTDFVILTGQATPPVPGTRRRPRPGVSLFTPAHPAPPTRPP